MKARSTLISLAGLLSVVVLVGAVSGAAHSALPPAPPSELPPLPRPGEMVGVLGPDGDPIRCADGEVLKVRFPDATPPLDPSTDRVVPAVGATPPPADGYAGPQVQAEQVQAEPLVPRCGHNDAAVWVPASTATRP